MKQLELPLNDLSRRPYEPLPGEEFEHWEQRMMREGKLPPLPRTPIHRS